MVSCGYLNENVELVIEKSRRGEGGVDEQNFNPKCSSAGSWLAAYFQLLFSRVFSFLFFVGKGGGCDRWVSKKRKIIHLSAISKSNSGLSEETRSYGIDTPFARFIRCFPKFEICRCDAFV